MTGRSRKRRARPLSPDEQLENVLKEARRRDEASENGAERLFAAMGIERPHKHRRAVDDFQHLVEHEPEQVARAMARRALEMVGDDRVPVAVRATGCMVASRMLTESVASERELAADLMRRAIALDPNFQSAPRSSPTVGLRTRPHNSPARRKSRVEIALERVDELLCSNKESTNLGAIARKTPRP